MTEAKTIGQLNGWWAFGLKATIAVICPLFVLSTTASVSIDWNQEARLGSVEQTMLRTDRYESDQRDRAKELAALERAVALLTMEIQGINKEQRETNRLLQKLAHDRP